MKKSILIAMATTLALASCQTDDILDNSGSTKNANNAIRFDGEAGKMSRAEDNSDHTKLGDKFVVYGTKTNAENNSTVVYNNYNVEWKGTTNTSSSNTNGWEYVGVGKNTLNTGATDQTIKYWDYSAKQYDFVAFSFGTATQGEDEDKIKAEQDATNKLKYTLTGKLENLAKCYFADKVTVSGTSKYGQPIQFSFRSTATKVSIKLYETIPGYSVKDVKFYNSDTEVNAPTLYAASATIPAGTGNGKVTIDLSSSPATATYEATDNNQNTTTISFGELSTYGKEGNETTSDGKYVGRDKSAASAPSDFTSVLPANAGKLTLKVDYTLESIDGSGEEIKVTGATAEIPDSYTNWQANYAYTYIFKISDKSNGSTGGESSGLHPITFDAIVTEAEDGSTTFEEIELKEPSSTPGE